MIRKKRTSIWLVALLTAGTLAEAATTEYFVDAVNGSDAYDGTAAKWAGGESTVGPKKTIQAAVNLIADGNGGGLSAGCSHCARSLVERHGGLHIE